MPDRERWVGQGFIFGRPRRVVVSRDLTTGEVVVYLPDDEGPGGDEVRALIDAGHLTPYGAPPGPRLYRSSPPSPSSREPRSQRESA